MTARFPCALFALLFVDACGGDGGTAETETPLQQPSCDVLILFATDGLTAVGCSGALCHSPEITAPDLMSESLEDRLLDQPANPEGPCAGETLVDSAEPKNSLLLKKINGASTCGSPMPLTNPSALTAEQVRCIEEYVELVAGGGRLTL